MFKAEVRLESIYSNGERAAGALEFNVYDTEEIEPASHKVAQSIVKSSLFRELSGSAARMHVSFNLIALTKSDEGIYFTPPVPTKPPKPEQEEA